MARRPWYKRPQIFALLKLRQFRETLRHDNLHNTSQIPDSGQLPKPPKPADDRHLFARTADGSYNDLETPKMGMAGTRFGRNVPLADAYPDEDKLLTPNPRLLSRRLVTRDEFTPATIVNLLVAAWIQFENQDWMFHGDNQPDNKINIPLDDDDDWPEEDRPMEVKRTIVRELKYQ